MRFLITSLFIVVVLSEFGVQRTYGQLTHDAVVTAEQGILRKQPNAKALIVATLTKGAKLIVSQASSSKGWYIAFLENAPSVIGYVHGNSIRLVTKSRPQDLPDNVPLVRSEQKAPPKPHNFCKPPLFCPDIDDVQVALYDNIEKAKKGKFEKTADWEKRRKTLLTEMPLKGGFTAASKMYFLYDFGAGGFTYDEAAYDADKEIWTINLDLRKTGNGTCAPIFSVNSGLILCLILPKELLEKNVTVPMAPSVAAINDRKINIAFIGKVVEPYIWSSIGNDSFRDITSGVYFELEEIVCINPQTGQQWKVNISKPQEIISPTDELLKKTYKEIVSNPMNAEAHLTLARALVQKSEYEKAIVSYKSAIYWKSNLLEAHIELGRVYLNQGNYEMALQYAKSALEIDGKNENALLLKNLADGFINETKMLLPKPLEPANFGKDIIKSPRNFEGRWEMLLEHQNEKQTYFLEINKKGTKYKGFLTDGRNNSSKEFDVKFDGSQFQFKLDWRLNYFQKADAKVEGTFDGFALKSSMKISTFGGSIIAGFNSL